MIQLYLNYYDPLFKENYNEFIDSLNFSSLRCSACHSQGHCTRHAFYTRNIITADVGKQPLEILRVQCRQCQTTHALLPDWIVPYSQVLLEDQLEIIRLYEAGETSHQMQPPNPEIDTWTMIYIIKQFLKHWKQRLLSHSLSLVGEIKQLITSCFKYHQRQFMQIKCTPNSLFSPTT